MEIPTSPAAIGSRPRLGMPFRPAPPRNGLRIGSSPIHGAAIIDSHRQPTTSQCQADRASEACGRLDRHAPASSPRRARVLAIPIGASRGQEGQPPAETSPQPRPTRAKNRPLLTGSADTVASRSASWRRVRRRGGPAAFRPSRQASAVTALECWTGLNRALQIVVGPFLALRERSLSRGLITTTGGERGAS